LSNFIFVDRDEFSYRPVKSFFDIIRKKAGRELIHTPVVLDTFAADPFAAAWLPRAVTFL